MHGMQRLPCKIYVPAGASPAAGEWKSAEASSIWDDQKFHLYGSMLFWRVRWVEGLELYEFFMNFSSCGRGGVPLVHDGATRAA